jgi:phage terminase large subunit GpA-like protein
LAWLTPPPRYTPATWADKYHEIPHGLSAEPGRYRISRLPYHQEPLESMVDQTSTETVLLWGRQLGKTELLIILICFIIDVDPSNIFVKYPTRGKAADFSQKKLNPTIKNNPRLRRKVRVNRMRDSSNTIFSKLFPGGSITMVGANSAAALRQLSCRVVIQDEIDSDHPNSEGDPVPQADATATTFHNRILVKSSTPTQEPDDDGRGGQIGSRIQILFNDSDQRFWNCACPKCGHWQVLRWSQVRWTWTNPDGTKTSDPERACYVCAGCQAELSDFDRVRMILHGKWVAQKLGNRRRGYHLSGLYRIMGKKRAYKSYLHEFVENFLKAKKEGSLEVWTNTFLAECWKQHFSKLETEPLLARCEQYGPDLSKKVLVLTRQVDVQGDRLEIMVKGWGLMHESWGISHTIILGNPHQAEVWKKLHALMEEEFTHPLLGKLHVPITLIDSGGQSNDAGFADPVYRFVRPRQPAEIGPGVYATKGNSKLDGALVTNRRPKKGICLKLIGTGMAKTTIHARLRNTEPGPRYMHYPQGYGFDAEYFAQLGAEAPRQKRVKGYTVTEWHKLRSRNEALDLEVLALAAVEILNPDLNGIAARVREKDPLALQDTKPVVSDPRPRPTRRTFQLSRPQFRRRWTK